MQYLKRLTRRAHDRGASLVEYALLVALIAVVCIGAGDLAFLARAMLIAFLVFAPAAVSVLLFDLGIGWLWLALTLLFLARAVVLGRRFHSQEWVRLGVD